MLLYNVMHCVIITGTHPRVCITPVPHDSQFAARHKALVRLESKSFQVLYDYDHYVSVDITLLVAMHVM